jgi:hypothetical protein
MKQFQCQANDTKMTFIEAMTYFSINNEDVIKYFSAPQTH